MAHPMDAGLRHSSTYTFFFFVPSSAFAEREIHMPEQTPERSVPSSVRSCCGVYTMPLPLVRDENGRMGKSGNGRAVVMSFRGEVSNEMHPLEVRVVD